MQKVEFGDAKLPGYVAGEKGAPGLIVLQEWWGVNDIIKELATTVAGKGFRVLIPDLYKGKIGVDAEEAHHLMNNLDFPNAIQEMKQAVQYLRDEGCSKVGAVGFCMGGALTFCAAQHSGVDAAAPFYGTPDPRVCDITQIKVPLQVHFGKEDAMKGFSDPETMHQKVADMKKAGVNVESFEYDGCGHGFMNQLVPGGADKLKMINSTSSDAATKQALDRTVDFFKKNLA